MKTRVLLFVFVLWISLCFTSVSAVASGPIKVSDKLIERINHKNKCYAKTPLKIRLTLISMPSQHSEQVQKVKNNQVLILLMDKNLRIKVGSKMQKILSVSKCNTIILYVSKYLRSNDKIKQNQGLEKAVNAIYTIIDKEYNLPFDSSDLTSKEMDKILHPQRNNLIWTVVVVVIFSFIITYTQRRRFSL